MHLPGLIQSTRQPVSQVPPPPPPPAALDDAAGGAGPARILGFIMQHQQQTQWCWSAVSVSVSLFYNPNSTWRQCTLVNAELGLNSCCKNGASTACNRPNVLDSPLKKVGNLDTAAAATASFSTVMGEINASEPVACRIGWFSGGGHFVVLYGYDDSTGKQLVHVADPWNGASTYAYASFKSRYRNAGSWTHTYRTRR